jgi:hypothetical protein
MQLAHKLLRAPNNHQSTSTMAPRNEEQKEKNRLGSQALREKKNQMAKAKKESAQKSKKKHTENVKLEKEQVTRLPLQALKKKMSSHQRQ